MDEMMMATLRGARSLRVRGWMREECESAALERICRHPCLSAARAYEQGRAAALDELRRLSGWRRRVVGRTVPIDTNIEVAVEESGFAVIDSLDALARSAPLSPLTIREAQAVRLLADGLTGREAAVAMSVDPSRISTLRRAASTKVDRRRLRPCP